MPIYKNDSNQVIIHFGVGDILPNPQSTHKNKDVPNILALGRLLPGAKKVGETAYMEDIIETPCALVFDNLESLEIVLGHLCYMRELWINHNKEN